MPNQKVNALITTSMLMLGLGLLTNPAPVQADGQLLAPNVMVIFANSFSMNRKMDDLNYPSVSSINKYRFDDNGYTDQSNPDPNNRGTYITGQAYGDDNDSKLYQSKQAFAEVLADNDISANLNIGFATFRTMMGGRVVVQELLTPSTGVEIRPKDGLAHPIYTEGTNPEKLAFGTDTTNFSLTLWWRQRLTWGSAGGACTKNETTAPLYGRDTGNINTYSGLNIMDDSFADYLTEKNGFGGILTKLRYHALAVDQGSTATDCNSADPNPPYAIANNTGARSTAEQTANEPVIQHYLCRIAYNSQNNRFYASYLGNRAFKHTYPGPGAGNTAASLTPDAYLFDPSNNEYVDNQGNLKGISSYNTDRSCDYYPASEPVPITSVRSVITDQFLNVGPLAGNPGLTTTAYMSYIPNFSTGGATNRSYSKRGELTGWSGESNYIYNCPDDDNDDDETDCITSLFPAGVTDPAKVGRNLVGIPADNDAGIPANPNYKYVVSGINHMGVFLDLPDPSAGYVDQRSTINGYMELQQMSHSGLDYNPVSQTISDSNGNSKGISVSQSGGDAQSPIYMSLLNAYAYYRAYKQADPFDSCRSNNILLFYDGKEDGRWTSDENGNKVYVKPEEIAQRLHAQLGVKVYVVIISANAGDIHQANLIAQHGGTLQAYTAASKDQLKDAFTTVFAGMGLMGEVSELAAGIPLQIKAGKKAFIASRLVDPSEGHLRAYSFTDSGSLVITADWDAATEMTVAERTARLYSSDNDTDGVKIAFNSLDNAAFSAVGSPTVAAIKAYTLDPDHSSGLYLAGRSAGSLLGSISRGNAVDILTSKINRGLYLQDPDYRPYYNGTVSGRSEKVLISSDDGFLYAFDQSDGDLAWGWMPRSLVKYLKGFNTFQGQHFMQGGLDILDVKHGGSYGTYAVGGYGNGLGHYVLKIANDGDLESVIWDEDRSTQLQSPNHGEMDYFKNTLDSTTYGTYVVTDNANQSTLVIRNIADATDITEITLNFTATSTPFVIPDYKRAQAPGSKTLYLGDSNGNIHNAALLDISGALKSTANLQIDFDDNDTINFGDNASPILFMGTAQSAKDRKYYLRAQSEDRLTVFRHDADNNVWKKQWSSYITGAGTWDSGGVYTADNSGVPTDNDNDGFATDVPNGIQSLLANSKITDSATIVADSIVLPVSVDSGPSGALSCGSPEKAFYYLYKLSDGTFPGHTFYHHPDSPEAAPDPANPTAPVDLEITQDIWIGYGEAQRVQIKDLPGKDQQIGYGQADQNKAQGISPSPAFVVNTSLSTGIKGWAEIGRY